MGIQMSFEPLIVNSASCQMVLWREEKGKKKFFIPLKKKHWDSGETILFPWKEVFSQFGWMTTYIGNDVMTGYAKEIKPGSFEIKLS